MIKPLALISNKKEALFLFLLLLIVFLINIFSYYPSYKDFKSYEIYVTNAKILNIFKKGTKTTIKCQNANFTFFTNYTSDINLSKNDTVSIMLVTKNTNFIDYVKGFYVNSFNIHKLTKIVEKHSIKNTLSNLISKQHSEQNIKDLYNALFLAIPLEKIDKEFFSKFGISHLIAISGFHLGVLSFIIYWFLYIFYSPLQDKYFPYRNKKFDLLILTSIFLFFYLILLSLVPSLLRAFLMYIMAIFFLRNNIKVLSFQSLLIVVLIIISIFPKLLFSLSLWFSVLGVFYIFLFIQYFKNLHKVIQFILFNIWIYLAMNPIIHYFFYNVSYEQLLSPIITLGFTVFYPLVLFLHLISYGYIFDDILQIWLNYDVNFINVTTPTWFFYFYLMISLLSIFYKKAFVVLNVSFVIFFLVLYFKLVF